MATTSHPTPEPAKLDPAELIRRMPDPDTIRDRLAEIARERDALMTLLRGARHLERARKSGGAA